MKHKVIITIEANDRGFVRDTMRRLTNNIVDYPGSKYTIYYPEGKENKDC